MGKIVVCVFFLLGLFGFHQAFAQRGSANVLSDMTVSWMLDPHSGIVNFELTANCACWVGIGWHEAGSTHTSMGHADFFITTFDSNGDPVVVDSISVPDDNLPVVADTTIGGSNDVLSFSGKQTKTTSTVFFTRKLVTNDSIADHPLSNATLNFIFAHGDVTSANPNVFGYHGTTSRVKVGLNLFTGSVGPSSSSNDTFLYLHGIFMLFGYGICMPFGIFLARYLKDYHWWFPLHYLSQIVGVSGAVIGLSCIVKYIETAQYPHFSNPHSWIGLLTLSGSFLAISLGIAAHFQYEPQRTAIPVWPDKVHWGLGRVTLLMGWIAIILGLNQYGAPVALQGGVALVPAFSVFVVMFVDLYRCYYSRRGQIHFYQPYQPNSSQLLKDHD